MKPGALINVKRSARPILVVDDDALICEAVQSLLELEGYAVVVAPDGEDALHRLRAGLEPALILLDLTMPVKDGFQFRREQLADARLASIPTIVWSAASVPRGDGNHWNGTTFLRKGVDFDTLLACIEAQRRTH